LIFVNTIEIFLLPIFYSRNLIFNYFISVYVMKSAKLKNGKITIRTIQGKI